MLPISVCIIGKNEEKYIGKCLQSLLSHFSEIIYVDTGSTDRTVDIASAFTQHVYQFDWVDDFSVARNYSISLASNNWVFIIDCDESLQNISEKELNIFITKQPHSIGRVLRKNIYYIGEQEYIMQERISRLFPKSHYHYTGSIHEQVTSLSSDFSKEYMDAPITLMHEGYNATPDLLKQKAGRNIHLLLKELENKGPDAYLYFQVGQSYFMIGSYQNACYYFDLGLSLELNPAEEYVQLMIESYGYSLIYTKQFQRALQFVNIYDSFCHKADFVFLMGLIYMNNALFEKAIAEFEKATTISVRSVEGVNSYMPYYNIGVIYECTGDIGKAISYYSKCGSYPPANQRFTLLSPDINI